MERTPSLYFLVHWKRHSVPSFAAVSGSIPWSILAEEATRLDQFIQLVKTLAGDINAVYGDVQNMAFPGWDTPLDLRVRLPDVPWLSFYGRPYIQMFGKVRIETAPFYKVQRLQSGHYLLQAGQSLWDPVPEPTKDAIRKHLGEDAFMSGGRWRYKTGRAPDFDFANVVS